MAAQKNMGLRKIKSKKQPEEDKNKNNQQNEDKPLAYQYKDGDRESKQLVFLQSTTNFIEKNLGPNEKIKLRPECIAAFSSTVSFLREFDQAMVQMFSSKSKFVVVNGPGMLYIDMQAGNRFQQRERTKLMVILIYLSFYILALSLMALDRREA